MILFSLASLPSAVKTLAVIVAVYGLLQAVKKVPALTPYLTGWLAIALNVALTAGGLLITIPAAQLYSVNTITSTLTLLLTTSAAAAGIHGTIKSLRAPTVLAVTPPATEAKEIPATLIPDDPAAIPVQPVQKREK